MLARIDCDAAVTELALTEIGQLVLNRGAIDTAPRVLEEILAEKQAHADELKESLAD